MRDNQNADGSNAAAIARTQRVKRAKREIRMKEGESERRHKAQKHEARRHERRRVNLPVDTDVDRHVEWVCVGSVLG